MLLLIAGGSALLYRNGFFRSGMAATAFQNPSISSLTSSGDVILARISPDGRYLAYISNQRGQFSLWVRQIATASAVQIVPPGSNVIIDAVFSPDGNFLNFSMSAIEESNAKVYQVPVLGGSPRRLLDAVQTSITFSPDGNLIAYSILNQQTNDVDIMIANADGSSPRKLATQKSATQYAVFQVAHWSPDGKRIVATVKDANDPNGQVGALEQVDVATGKISSRGWPPLARHSGFRLATRWQRFAGRRPR